MRELTNNEIHQTSGGTFGILIAPIGAFIGWAVGQLVDEALAGFGFETDYAGAGASLGAGIGALIGLSPIMTMVFMSQGIQGLVDNGISIGQQVKANNSASA